MLTWHYATRCPISRSPPDLVAGRLQHLGSLIQPIGRDEDEVAVVARNHPGRHATGRFQLRKVALGTLDFSSWISALPSLDQAAAPLVPGAGL
jgi:hypothetical protein